MLIAAVVADANVLLSAAAGKAARRVFDEFAVEVHAAEFTFVEVEEYLPLMAAKYGLEKEIIQLAWELLPIRVHAFSEYRRSYPQALSVLKARDPEDAHALAMARMLHLPLWSNDLDLKKRGVLYFPTAILLKNLGKKPTHLRPKVS